MNIPIEAEERSVPGIYDPNFVEDHRYEHQGGHNPDPRETLRLIHDPLCFQNPRIRAIFHTNPQSVRFLRAKSIDPKTY